MRVPQIIQRVAGVTKRQYIDILDELCHRIIKVRAVWLSQFILYIGIWFTYSLRLSYWCLLKMFTFVLQSTVQSLGQKIYDQLKNFQF